jgi:hypothetical protein
MDRQKEAYRQQIIGWLQLWEGKIAHLRTGAKIYEGIERHHYEARLHELEACNRTVFGRYADLLLADAKLYDEKRMLLDAAARHMDELLMEFALQPT